MIESDGPTIRAPQIIRASAASLQDTIRSTFRDAGFSACIRHCDGSALHPAGDGYHAYIVKASPRRNHSSIKLSIENALVNLLTLPAMVLIEMGGIRFSVLGVGANPALVKFCHSYVSFG